MAEQYSASIVEQAITCCMDHNLYSAFDCWDMANRQEPVKNSTIVILLLVNVAVEYNHVGLVELVRQYIY